MCQSGEVTGLADIALENGPFLYGDRVLSWSLHCGKPHAVAYSTLPPFLYTTSGKQNFFCTFEFQAVNFECRQRTNVFLN